MAKHKYLGTCIHPMRHLLLAVLVLGWAAAGSGAEPQSANTGQTTATGQARTARLAHNRTSASNSDSDSASSAAQSAGKRDPFKLPQFGTGKGGSEGLSEIRPGEVLPPGKRGLIISQLKLEGVVRQMASNKMTAMVVDQRKLAYFLHDNDAVYNGVVSKITPDAVYFTENVLDSKGHVTTREVVKRLGSAPGEGR